MLERGVVTKKMSKIDKNGKLGWTIGEVAILRCPVADSQVDCTEVQKADVQTGLVGPANKKTRHSLILNTDQSEKQYHEQRVIEDR